MLIYKRVPHKRVSQRRGLHRVLEKYCGLVGAPEQSLFEPKDEYIGDSCQGGQKQGNRQGELRTVHNCVECFPVSRFEQLECSKN